MRKISTGYELITVKNGCGEEKERNIEKLELKPNQKYK